MMLHFGTLPSQGLAEERHACVLPLTSKAKAQRLLAKASK